MLRLVSLGCTFAALVSRSLPALSPSVAVPGLPSPELDDAPSAPGSLLPTQCAFPYFAHGHPWLPPVPDMASSPWVRTGSCCTWVGALHSIVPRLCWIRKGVAGTGALFSPILVVL